MFGLVDENKKFILLDYNYEKLRATALLMVKKVDGVFVQMFDKNFIDELIKEYKETDIKVLENGDRFLNY
jgi:hypothetical protein